MYVASDKAFGKPRRHYLFDYRGHVTLFLYNLRLSTLLVVYGPRESRRQGLAILSEMYRVMCANERNFDTD